MLSPFEQFSSPLWVLSGLTRSLVLFRLYPFKEIMDNEYEGLYGYSIGVTAPRQLIYEYPEYGYEVTRQLTNLDGVGAELD